MKIEYVLVKLSQNGDNGAGATGGNAGENTEGDAPRWDEWEPGDPSSPYYEQGWAPHGGPESQQLSDEEYERMFGHKKDSDASKEQGGNIREPGRMNKAGQKIKGAGGKVKAAGSRIKNSTGGKLAIRGAKTAGKKIWKNKRGILRRAAGITGGVALGGIGAVIGAASAIAQGDAGKVLTNATVGATAGYMGGSSFGRGAVDFVAGTGVGAYHAVSNAKNTVTNAYNEEKYGLEEARQMRLAKENEKAKKAFMKNDEEKRKYKEIATKINSKNNTNFSVNDIMSAAYDYKNAGVDDDDKIATGLNLEIAHSPDNELGGKNHDRMINVMQEVGHFSQDYILDERKRASLEDSMRAQLGEEKGQEFMDLFAEAHGQEDYYKKVKQQREQRQANNNTQSGIEIATDADFRNEINGRNNDSRGRNSSRGGNSRTGNSSRGNNPIKGDTVRNNNPVRGNSSGNSNSNGGNIFIP